MPGILQPCILNEQGNRCKKGEVDDGNCVFNQETGRCKKKKKKESTEILQPSRRLFNAFAKSSAARDPKTDRAMVRNVRDGLKGSLFVPAHPALYKKTTGRGQQWVDKILPKKQHEGLVKTSALYLGAKHKKRCTVLPTVTWISLYPKELFVEDLVYDSAANYYRDKELSTSWWAWAKKIFTKFPGFAYGFDETVDEATKEIVEGILADERGWRFDYKRTDKDPFATADVVLSLLPNATIVERYGEAFDGLSVTRMTGTPKRVAINASNWAAPPVAFKGSLDTYRAYLIMHEIGHAHGYFHMNPAKGNDACPIMYQQTKGASKNGPCPPSGFPYPSGKFSAVTWNDDTFEPAYVSFTGTRAIDVLKADVAEAATRFVVVPLTIESGIKGEGRHGNVLIFDKLTRVLERFDPNGMSDAGCDRSDPYRFHAAALRNGLYECTEDALDAAIEANLGPLFGHETYLPPHSVCPINLNIGKTTPGVDPGGFCFYWSVWYTDLRLTFPDQTPQETVAQAVKAIGKGTDFFEFIRSYALFLDTVERLRESVGLVFEEKQKMNDFLTAMIEEFTKR